MILHKSKYKLLLSILFALLISFIGGSLTPWCYTSWAERTLINLSPYYDPLFNVGNEWTFLENGFARVKETVLADKYEINGLPTTLLEDNGGVRSGALQSWSKNRNGYCLHGLHMPALDVEGWGTFDVTGIMDPAPHVGKQVRVGDIIETTGTVECTIPDFGTYTLGYTYSQEFVEIERVSVPLGSAEAIKIQTKFIATGDILHSPVSVEIHTTAWLVPNIGPAKVILNGDVRELTGINF